MKFLHFMLLTAICSQTLFAAQKNMPQKSNQEHGSSELMHLAGNINALPKQEEISTALQTQRVEQNNDISLQEEEKKIVGLEEQSDYVALNEVEAKQNCAQKIEQLCKSAKVKDSLNFTITSYLLLLTVWCGYKGEAFETVCLLAAYIASNLMTYPRFSEANKLRDAIINDDASAMKNVIAKGWVNINETTPFRLVVPPVEIALTSRPLVTAIKGNKYAMIQLLLEKGARVQKEDLEAVQVDPEDSPEIKQTKEEIKKLLQEYLARQ